MQGEAGLGTGRRMNTDTSAEANPSECVGSGGVAGLQSSPGPHGVAASGVSLRQTYLVFVKLN